MGPYHDRMPVLLTAEHFDAWLNGTMRAEDLKPAAKEALRAWPVAKRLNKSGDGDEDPAIIEPIGELRHPNLKGLADP
jgi:putative SOS response-associated peptidase YedK